MRLQNRSARHTTAKLLPIIEFVTSRTKYSALATLRLVDAKDPKAFSGGYAWKQDPACASSLALVARSLVEITLSSGATYPRATRHVPEVGEVVIHSWEEEVLFVIAHELRHVDAFWEDEFGDEHAAEVDAETFAVKVLRQFRRSRSARTTAAASSCGRSAPSAGAIAVGVLVVEGQR